MDYEDFRECGRDMVDYIATYRKKVDETSPLPAVSPGYLQELIPDTAPEDGEKWEDVLADIDRVIMPGVTHWTSSHFHAYFPAGNSFPSLLGDMLCDAIGCIGLTWMSGPACTELEMCVMNWLGKMLQLPSDFLFSKDSLGGGCIQGSATESTLVAILSARASIARQLKAKDPDVTQGQILDRLMAYVSEESHCSVQKAATIAAVQMRILPTDACGSLRGTTLQLAMKEDRVKGYLPFFVCATVGTTSSCAFDNLEELGPICQDNNVWLHVDAAYAGSACICPEYRHLLNGVEHCSSLSSNAHKWLQVHFDCSLMWVKNHRVLADAFEFNPTYLKDTNGVNAMPEFRNWQVPTGRRFRSLKLWFVLRMFGVKGLQEYIRKDVSFAKQFEKLVRQDHRFEIFGKVDLSLVCFRLKGDNKTNEALVRRLNEDKRIYLIPSVVRGTFFLRFVPVASKTKAADVTYAWDVIQEVASRLLEEGAGH